MNKTAKILNLSNKLRNKGFNKYADELEYNLLILKSSETAVKSFMKQAQDKLLLEAHPEGSVNLFDGNKDLSEIEDLLDQKKKILNVVKKDPTGKLASLVYEEIYKQAQLATGFERFMTRLEGILSSKPTAVLEIIGVVPKFKQAFIDVFEKEAVKAGLVGVPVAQRDAIQVKFMEALDNIAAKDYESGYKKLYEVSDEINNLPRVSKEIKKELQGPVIGVLDKTKEVTGVAAEFGARLQAYESKFQKIISDLENEVAKNPRDATILRARASKEIVKELAGVTANAGGDVMQLIKELDLGTQAMSRVDEAVARKLNKQFGETFESIGAIAKGYVDAGGKHPKAKELEILSNRLNEILTNRSVDPGKAMSRINTDPEILAMVAKAQECITELNARDQGWVKTVYKMWGGAIPKTIFGLVASGLLTGAYLKGKELIGAGGASGADAVTPRSSATVDAIEPTGNDVTDNSNYVRKYENVPNDLRNHPNTIQNHLQLYTKLKTNPNSTLTAGEKATRDALLRYKLSI